MPIRPITKDEDLEDLKNKVATILTQLNTDIINLPLASNTEIKLIIGRMLKNQKRIIRNLVRVRGIIL